MLADGAGPELLRDRTLLQLGGVLALMNCCFYLAIGLPLATVAAIEFLPVIALAALGAARPAAPPRSSSPSPASTRSPACTSRAACSAWLAFANAALFALYIVLGHRVAQGTGLDGLAASMLAALVAVTPLALLERRPRFDDSIRDRRRGRRRRRLVGHPLRVRPARDGAAGPARASPCSSRSSRPRRP